MHRICSHVLLCSLLFAMAFTREIARAQFRSSCPIITSDEAAAVIGGKPSRTEDGPACTYKLPGGSVTMIVEIQGVGSSAPMIFADSRREFVGKGAVVKDEPGIGLPAFSFVNGDNDERASGFFVLKGSGVLMVIVIQEKPRGLPKSAGMLDKLRPAIKKAAGRI
jgi:hypothetical protein